MTNKIEIKTPTQGIIGYLHEIDFSEKNSILVFQLPRTSDQINRPYIESARKVLSEVVPEGHEFVFIGCDVNVYEIAEAESVILKLKGLI
jgi:hypothetical protein